MGSSSNDLKVADELTVRGTAITTDDTEDPAIVSGEVSGVSLKGYKKASGECLFDSTSDLATLTVLFRNSLTDDHWIRGSSVDLAAGAFPDGVAKAFNLSDVVGKPDVYILVTGLTGQVDSIKVTPYNER